MIYGILMFVLQMGSRRQTNEKLTAPAMKEQLLGLFPDFESIPHHDTLGRLLTDIDVDQIEAVQVALARSLIRRRSSPTILSRIATVSPSMGRRNMCASSHSMSSGSRVHRCDGS